MLKLYVMKLVKFLTLRFILTKAKDNSWAIVDDSDSRIINMFISLLNRNIAALQKLNKP